MATDPDLDPDDVPSPIDLRDPDTARAWLADAELRRPFRPAVRARIAEEVKARGATRVLELGGGPGLLAEAVVAATGAAYTLVDFSPPMLAMARQRAPTARGVLRDLRDPGWVEGLGRFDAAVTMQAVHELRHKRRAPRLYAQVHGLLEPGAVFVVCDHTPSDARPLYMTAEEQHAALGAAGFVDVTTVMTVDSLYVITAARPAGAATGRAAGQPSLAPTP
ncbi:MAG: class I SAM-dependent methyltransferase [Myxococcales bacterium]|nr:class I SAM-dependent methyltransferase [Myxococcales bacterium]